MRVTKMTIDLVRDEDNKLWFLGLKSYELDADCYVMKRTLVIVALQLVGLHATQRDRRGTKTSEGKGRKHRYLFICSTSIAVCKMCNLHFKLIELSKRLTLQMIYTVKEHMELRGLSLLAHLKCLSPETMTQTIRICVLCYSVAVAEYALIETECKLAQIQGLPASIDNYLDSLRRRGTTAHSLWTQSLHQWRVLLHLESLQNLPAGLLNPRKDYRVQCQLFGQTFSFPLSVKDSDAIPEKPCACFHS